MNNSLVNFVYNLLNTKTLTDSQKVSVYEIIRNASKKKIEGTDYSIQKTGNYIDLTIDLESYDSETHIKLYELVNCEMT
jgi:hypothetical protein